MASRRQYLTQAELAQYSDITITDATEADDRISQAEEIIDAYVGTQDQFLPKAWNDIEGQIQSVVGANQFQLEARHCSVYLNNFFSFCEVEILGGTGAGQRMVIQSSTYAGFITTVSNFSPVLDSTSFYRIYQLGKFPRKRDSYLDAIHTPQVYYKNIPEEVKRAVAAQVQYMIEQGDAYFSSDDIFKNTERIGDYEYQKARDGSGTGISMVIAPKAKWYLRGLTNRKGIMVV